MSDADKTLPKAPIPVPRLPAGAEFSPGQVDLQVVLELADRHSGDRHALVEALRKRYFAEAGEKLASDPAARLEQQAKRANNVVIGMGSYGLYDSSSRQLTDSGAELLAEPNEEKALQAFARHIMTRRFGLEVIDAVRSLQRRDVTPSKLNLADELRRRGFDLPNATTHHLTLLAWLERAGVVRGRGREIDDHALQLIVGGSAADVHEVLSLSAAHQAYLQTIQQIARGKGDEIQVRQVDQIAEETHGAIFGPEDQRKRRIRDPLIEAGWIEVLKTGGGRGGKSGVLRPAEKLLELDPELLGRPAASPLPADLLDQLDRPLDDVYTDLLSEDKHTKGVALELLAVNIAFDLGLEPVAFRLRARETTGGTEVDLVAEAVRLQFSRWVFQCKNTAKVDLKVATREIGVADIVHAHLIVIVTTGRFTRDTPAVRAALAAATEKQIVLVDGSVLRRYEQSGATALLSHFREQARGTMETKRGQGLRLLREFGA